VAIAIRAFALWIGSCTAVLQILLFLIARFYQRTAGEPTRSGLFLVSMALLLSGELMYGWQTRSLAGNKAADLLLLIGGSTLAGNGYLLFRAMCKRHQ
jgi:hypothetical protein